MKTFNRISEMAFPENNIDKWIKVKQLWGNRTDINNIIKMEENLKDIVNENPLDFDAWMWYGRVAHFQAMFAIGEKSRNDFFQAASKRFSKARDIDSYSKSALYWWAMCEHPEGDYEEVLIQVKNNLAIKNSLPLLPTLNDESFQEALLFFEGRENADQAYKALDSFKNFVKQYPDEILGWLWLSRTFMYIGTFETENSKRVQLFNNGYEAAKKAIFLSNFDPAAHYFLSSNLGLSVENSLMKQFGASKEIINSLRILASEDADFRCGGITYYQAFGIARSGVFTRKIMNILGVREELVLKTVTIFSNIYPNNFEGKLAAAELAYSMGKIEVSTSFFNEIINNSPYEDPEYAPENLICLREALRFIEQKKINVSN